ncbi:glycoside hydrolase family 3 protein [Panaeolus papilionaceus]|nr:glycoside hydrolase family 3 protein [Panaeolus papilionaceus]
MSDPFLTASIPELVKKLRVEEKISLLGAPNWWNTSAIPRLGIPSVRMSDGPNGVRGSSHFVPTPAQCLPCATALASTFNPELIVKLGKFLGQEAKIKSSVILLAPTCNIQRTPLGGRAFESFSEDPHLSGTIAAAYVEGLQSEGVAACIKHFVGNDQEDQRTAADSVMTERALREIYLYPFMWAQKHAQPWAYMTSYGRIDGIHCSENPRLLKGILRNEWKFDGIVISDWHGTYSVDQALNAGLDLEMPGPPKWRNTTLVMQTLSAQKLSFPTLEERVTKMLTFVQKQARRNPKVVFGDHIERSREGPELREFCREVATEGIVLLKNKDSLLPLDPRKTQKIAVIGPNAKGYVISGGGSAALKATYIVTPFDGIQAALGDSTTLSYHIGCYAHKYLPTLENQLKTPEGKTGWLCTFYTHDSEQNPDKPVQSFHLNDTRVKLNDFLPQGLGEEWSIKLEGTLQLDQSAEFEFGLAVAGRAKLWVNDKLLIDNWTKQTPGDFFYGQGTVEEKGSIQLDAGKPASILVWYTNKSPPVSDSERDISQPALMRGVRLGGCEKIDEDQAIVEAVEHAKSSDAVIFIAGLTPEWESEGFDRPDLELPGRQDEVIARVAEANPKTIVCVQAGSAVSMPWVDKVGGLVQAWYLGNETGNAIADIIFGKVNPSGRLPLTFPVREQDIPAYLSDKCENGKIYYREDLFVGYKFYQARGINPLFPFGFGLSYTTFQLEGRGITSAASLYATDGVWAHVKVRVSNIGKVAGAEVVQVYISGVQTHAASPKVQLRGYAKTKTLAPGASEEVTVALDKYAFASWDEVRHAWVVPPGTYTIRVGRSSDKLETQDEFVIGREVTWVGL